LNVALWFKEARYRILCIIDHDEKRTLNNLLEAQINFLACPKDKNFEEFIEMNIDTTRLSNKKKFALALRHDTSENKLYFKPYNNSADSIRTSWPDLFNILKDITGNEGKTDDIVEQSFYSKQPQNFSVEEIMEKIFKWDESNPSTLKLADFLKRNKRKTGAFELAMFLSSELNEIPDLLKIYLDKIQDMYENNINGQFYLDETGMIQNYTRS
jgi:hypothetical protein